MKKIILSYIVVLFSSFIYGQEYEKIIFGDNQRAIDYAIKYREEAINKSEFVFEGTILRALAYRRNEQYVMSYIVNVEKVLRGKLKPGTVEIVNYEDIAVAHDRENWHRGLYKNDTAGIFFCKVADDLPPSKKYNIDTVDNKTVLSGYHNDRMEGLDYIQVTKDEYCLGFYRRWESTNEVYAYLRTFPNLNVPKDVPKMKPTRTWKRGKIQHYSNEYCDSLKNAKARKKVVF